MEEYIISLEKIDDQDRSRSLCISMAKWRRSQNVKSLSLDFIYDSYIMETLYLYNITVNN